MTVSFPSAPASPHRPSPLAAIVIGTVGVVTFLGLVLAGLVCFGLAIAFPIAVPLAAATGVPVTAHDAALARQLAGVTPLFIALTIAAFGASIAVLAWTVRSIAPVE